MRRLGIDIGSVSIGTVLLDNGSVIHSTYVSHKGEIHRSLSTLINDYVSIGFDSMGITSSVFPVNNFIIDPVLAVIEGAKFSSAGSRNVFAIGGERYYLIVFDEKGEYREHSENPACASGTGSFIDQQAERLAMSVTELAEKARNYVGTVPGVATRCAVFAKSDIVCKRFREQEAVL